MPNALFAPLGWLLQTSYRRRKRRLLQTLRRLPAHTPMQPKDLQALLEWFPGASDWSLDDLPRATPWVFALYTEAESRAWPYPSSGTLKNARHQDLVVPLWHTRYGSTEVGNLGTIQITVRECLSLYTAMWAMQRACARKKPHLYACA